MNLGLLRAVAGQLFDSFEFLSLMFRAEDLFDHRIRDLLFPVQVVVELKTDEVPHKSSNRFAARCHVSGPELGLRL